jgi:predicted acetyltransferase
VFRTIKLGLGGISMEVRKIKPEERITASKIQAIAFTSGQDFSGIEADSEKKIQGYETGRAAFNDEGKMCACIELIPYEVMFNKHIVNMAGIGGVASLPEERRNGYVREIFKKCFIEMRENKQWFSYLYPFSNIYYRKFGYESCLRRTKTTIPLDSFKHFSEVGKVKHYIPGTDDKDIRNIYNKFIKDKNLAVVRNDKLWKNHIEQDTYKNNLYTYVWYSDEGEAKGYITFKSKDKGQYKYDMQVQELIYIDDEGLLGILGFVKRFIPRYENFIWENPDFLKLNLLFPEPSDVKVESYSAGMNRIVDLQEVLKLVEYPGDEGTLAFKVYDNFLEWNNGTFVVNWGQNGIEVDINECQPDLSCSIEVLTQLVTGFTDLEELSWDKAVKIEGNHALLSKLFKKNKLYINDYF